MHIAMLIVESLLQITMAFQNSKCRCRYNFNIFLFVINSFVNQNFSLMLILVIQAVYYYSVPARLGKGQGAKEIGHNLARERPKFGHNLVRKRHKIWYSLERE